MFVVGYGDQRQIPVPPSPALYPQPLILERISDQPTANLVLAPPHNELQEYEVDEFAGQELPMIFVCGVFVATPSISKDHESRLEQRTDAGACVAFWAFSLRDAGWRKGSSCRAREN
ncbi:hypothetical protein H9L39_18432 [Fusarium oxysporum f. sp. albedinis]|nr:hypothetical protein H9L39_18432 [Fusarium oxysporum f. sp. albedinis]